MIRGPAIPAAPRWDTSCHQENLHQGLQMLCRKQRRDRLTHNYSWCEQIWIYLCQKQRFYARKYGMIPDPPNTGHIRQHPQAHHGEVPTINFICWLHVSQRYPLINYNHPSHQIHHGSNEQGPDNQTRDYNSQINQGAICQARLPHWLDADGKAVWISPGRTGPPAYWYQHRLQGIASNIDKEVQRKHQVEGMCHLQQA